MRNIFFLTALFLICPSIYAVDYFYCGDTTAYARLGDALEHVLKICGTPKSSAEKKVIPLKPIEGARWIYNFQPNSAFITKKLVMKENALIVDFNQNDKLIQIQVEGKVVTQTNYCQTAKTIKLGDTKIYVYQICPNPSIMKNTTINIPQKEILQTTLTYQQNQYIPATTLIFNDKKLAQILPKQ
jgi:hypothetical protein